MSTPEKGGKRTRGEFLPEDHPMAQFPDIEEYGYILDWLQELGPSKEGHATSWSDLKAWSELSGRNPLGWEIDLLRQLCIHFVNKVHEFRDANSISPYMEVHPDEESIAEWQKSVARQEKQKDG